MATQAANPAIDRSATGNAPSTPTSLPPASPNSATTAPVDNLSRLQVRSTLKPELAAPDPLSKAEKPGFSPRTAPLPLTGAVAMAEVKRRNKQQQQQPLQQSQNSTGSRQTSPNPAVAAMQSLMGVTGMSRVTDAPTPSKLSEPMRQVAEKLNLPDSNASIDSEQVSPTSLTSFGTLEQTSSGHSMTATASDTAAAAGPQFVAEPAQMTDGATFPVNNGHLAVEDQDANKAFSYPGPPQPEQDQEGGPSRGMSLPGYGQSSPKSPASNKRHKCPYCSTDFTRHHNLKSHLLTHSQEKPYVCQTCQARFRRLHDLKRHTKLHTGERPHTCDKCGRRFARGDALARHNKGPGGCAGRRSSFGGDDEFGPDGAGEGMDGIEYSGHDDDDDGDAHGRRGSEPSRKRQQLETPQDPNREVYRQHSSTYPPAQHERMRGDMGPPTVVHPGSSTTTSPRDMSGQPSPAGGYYGGGQVFAEPGMMTHSPKPLSPGQAPDQHRLSVSDPASQGLGRNRSTSLTTQFQQAHFGRGSSAGGRTPPQPSAQFATGQPGPPPAILPPLGSSGQSHGRSSMQPTSHAGGIGGSSGVLMHHQMSASAQGGGQGSNPSSHSSHGRSSGSSMRDIAGHEQSDIWAYVRTIEQRFGRMQDEYELRLSRQQEEIISLKGQMSQLIGSYSSDMGGGQRGPPPYPS